MIHSIRLTPIGSLTKSIDSEFGKNWAGIDMISSFFLFAELGFFPKVNFLLQYVISCIQKTDKSDLNHVLYLSMNG